MPLTYAIYFLIAGILLITLIDAIGSVVSRKLNFNYAYFSLLSFAVFTSMGYYTTSAYGLQVAILVNGLLGLYDGTIGYKLSIILKANTGLDTDRSKELLNIKTAITMAVIACVFAYVGYLITKF